MGFFTKKSPDKSDLATASPAGAAAATTGSVMEFLRATVSRISRDHLPPESLDVRAHLLDNGYVDSLSSIELLTGIERRYGVRIEEMDIVGRLCNLEALAREIEARADGTAR